MKTVQGGISGFLTFVVLAGVGVLLIALFSNVGSGPAVPGLSPISTPPLPDQPESPLPTPSAPLARIGPPVLLAAGQIRLAPGNRDKIVAIVNKDSGSYIASLDPATRQENKLTNKILISPHLTDRWLVYKDQSSPGTLYQSRIKVINLTTKAEITLGSENSIQDSPDVSGNIIVWSEARGSKKSEAGIYSYDLTTGQEFIVVKNSLAGYPSISDDWIIYLQAVGSWPTSATGTLELRAHSLKTNEDFAIGLVWAARDARFGTFQAIDGDYVAWTKYDANRYVGELHVYDLKTRTDRQITAPTNGLPSNISFSAKRGIVVFSSASEGWTILDWLQPTPTSLSVKLPVESSLGHELSVVGDHLVWRVYLDRYVSESLVFAAKIAR